MSTAVGLIQVVAVVQARCSSSRLPGKVLAPILGQPMLLRQLERLRRAQSVGDIVVATSTEASDDPVARLCVEANIHCHRGSLNHVLQRFHEAAKPYAPSHVVRVTGDCPLLDPELLDRLVNAFLEGGWDYANNVVPRRFPHGLDVEVMRWSALDQAAQEANTPYEQEHVTPFIYHHPERFALGHLTQEQDLSGHRWTVDHPADLALVRFVYEALYPTKPNFSTQDVLELLAKHPEQVALNQVHAIPPGQA